MQEIFKTMDNLAKRGFDYFIAGLGAIMLVSGIVFTPKAFLSQEELWAITAFGFICVLGSLYVWDEKVNFKFRINLEKIAYKKFCIDQLTQRQKRVEKTAIEIYRDDLEEIS